jgi:hypothetical protein
MPTISVGTGAMDISTVMRFPIGSSPGKYCRTNESLTSTTLLASAISESEK